MTQIQGLVEYLMPLKTLAPTFARLDTQHQMLADGARVDALQRAITATVREGDVVVEIGTGTGLLAMLAVRAGAARVHAIEATELADLARQVITDNGMSDRVTVHRGFSTDLNLPELGDVLITETLGHLGVDEGIVATVADARARLLKPGARLLPQSIDVILALTQDVGVVEGELSYWQKPLRELDFSALRPAAAGRVYLRQVLDGELATTPKRALHIDLTQAEHAPRHFEASAVTRQPGAITGVVAWFESELAPDLRINSRSTSSWFPLFFPIEPALELPAFCQCHIRVEARDHGDDVAWSWSLETEAGGREGGR